MYLITIVVLPVVHLSIKYRLCNEIVFEKSRETYWILSNPKLYLFVSFVITACLVFFDDGAIYFCHVRVKHFGFK